MRVLIVDDDIVSLTSLQFILEEHIETIFTASNGEEGLEMFKKESPDIVITDINMPIMDGLAMATTIKKINPNTPIITTTTYSETRLLIRAIEIGINHFIFKPITGEKMRLVLELATEKVMMQRTIDQQQKKLADKVKQLEKLTLELGSIYGALKEKEDLIQIDLNQAKTIQSNFFPSKTQLINNLRFVINYNPVYDIGGDIYDISILPNGKIRVFIADATGHGIQAALVTMLIKSEYEKIKREFENPSETFISLNHTFCGEIYLPMAILFTALIVDIDSNENSLCFSTAGHPSFFLSREEQIEELKSKGPIIGATDDAIFAEEKTNFKLNDKIILYTDGLIEEINNLGETFDASAVKSLIEEKQNKPIDNILNHISNKLEDFKEGNDNLDDITTIGIEYNS